jgi:surface carbohydrate biosynthesis protein
MFNLNKFYFKPKKNEILIYDSQGAEYISEYLNKNSFEILHTRKEKLSILIILVCIFKLKFKKIYYIEEFIKYVYPKIIITFIDNNIAFYNLYKITNAKTIFIQNGIRSCWNDVFYHILNKKLEIIDKFKSQNFFVDYMLVWNNSVKNIYEKFIKGKFIINGSFRNNLLKNKKILTNVSPKVLLFISNFKNIAKSKIVGKEEYGKFIKNEKKLLFLLRDYCINNKYQIHVLGKNNSKKNNERNYYNKFFSCVTGHKFIPPSINRNTYLETLKYKTILTIESSLGHEMLARKKRVAFMSTHENIYPYNTLYFGWPNNEMNTGPFWTNKINYLEIKRLLDFVINTEESKWIYTVNKYKKYLINFEKNNNKLSEILIKEKLSHCIKIT